MNRAHRAKYPEHAKLERARAQKGAGEFLRWLFDEKQVVLARPHQHDGGCYAGSCMICGLGDGELVQEPLVPERVVAEFYGVDVDAYHREKDAMLDEIRTLQTGGRKA